VILAAEGQKERSSEHFDAPAPRLSDRHFDGRSARRRQNLAVNRPGSHLQFALRREEIIRRDDPPLDEFEPENSIGCTQHAGGRAGDRPRCMSAAVPISFNPMNLCATALRLGGILALLSAPAVGKQMPVSAGLALLIARHAAAHQVPETLAYRIIKRESGFNPKVHHLVYWGLMQISGASARSMGYRGPLEGLLDPDTNLTYGMPYLANAYIVARGNQGRAMMLYKQGYYPDAKREGLLGVLHSAAFAKPPP
jgi:soluble lytic murein transglycosylase-like protein